MRKLLLLIACVTIVSASYGQISAGLKTGLNLSTFGGYPGTAKYKPGLHFGVYMNIALNEKWSLQPEVLINTVGSKTEEKHPDYSFEGTSKLSYLSVPLSLQYSVGNFNIHVGPQLSFLLSAKEEYTISSTDSGVTLTESFEDDTKEYLKSVDLGLNFGAGFRFGKLGINARYSLGLSNISDEAEEDDYKLSNNSIQLSVLYRVFGN